MSRPTIGWDAVAYISHSNLQLNSELSKEELHKEVYSLLGESLEEEQYFEITASSEGRAERARSPESFNQTIKFYGMRVLYISAISALSKIGLSPVTAIHLISSVSGAICILIAAQMLPSLRHGSVIVAMPFIAIATSLADVSTMATPDALAAVLILSIFWCYFRNSRLIFIVFPLCLLVRTDLIILIGLLSFYLMFSRKYQLYQVLIGLAVSVACYLFLNSHFAQYGWSGLFEYTFINRVNYPANELSSVSLSDYLSVMKSRLPEISYYPAFFAFIAMAVVGMSIFKPNFESPASDKGVEQCTINTDAWVAILVSLLYVAAHYILFPAMWDRFFSAFYLLTTVLVVWKATQHLCNVGEA